MRFGLIARRSTPTNEALASESPLGWHWEQMTPEQALDSLVAGDVAVGRLDVLPTLDEPPRDASAVAVAAAAAVGASLVGVDLLPDAGGWTVLELNGAVELTHDYAPWGDVFAEIVSVLSSAALDRRAGRSPLAADIA
jgi:hypothetical protein